MTEAEFLATLAAMHRPDFPPELYQLFPLTCIFYRPRPPAIRKRKAGWDATHIERVPGKAPRISWKRKFAAFKKDSTAKQNTFSYAICTLMDPNGYGTVRRSLAHKGYSRLAGAVYATDQEMERERNTWRYHFIKYHFLQAYYMDRGEDNPDLQAMLSRIAGACPSHSAQLRLF